MVQNFNFFETPSPHIIIDNFLTSKLSKECLEECIDLEAFYEPAKIIDSQQQLDDCKECQKIAAFQKKSIRENDVIYMDKLYEMKRKDSIILTSLEEALLLEEFREIMNKRGFFHILRTTPTSETIISRYGMCDFYGYHVDSLPHKQINRLVTLVYYLNKEPEQFEGGDLIIAGETIIDIKKIKPKHNRAVIFQSETTKHAVETVKLLNDKFEGGRFSINFWLGFDNQWRFR